MNPSIKRLLGAILLIGTLGVSSIMAVRAGATDYERLGVQSTTQPVCGEITHG